MPEPRDWTQDLTIVDTKIYGYLLNVDHPKGGAKAAYFIKRGFKSDTPELFLSALFAHAKPSHLVNETETGYGRKYIYEGALETPDGVDPNVSSVWRSVAGDSRRFLVTAYRI